MTSQRTPAKIIPRAFPGIKPEEIQEIISNSRIKNHPAETVLCKEGAYEQVFYMILDGDCEVTKLINDSDKRILKTLTAGDFFGEMALIHNAPRAATVKTTTDVVVLELDKEGFNRVLHHSPSVSMTMVREISNRLKQNDQLAIEDLRLRAAELAQAYQNLAEQDLARRGFLSNVANDLRAPLRAASGHVNLIQKDLLSGKDLNNAAKAMAESMGEIISSVNNILFLQDLELVLPEFQGVDMLKIANDVISRFEKKAKTRHVKLRVKGERDLPHAAGDPSSLDRALSALVDNAIKFSAQGGEVEIRLRERNVRLEIAVEDHGVGIHPDLRPRIFERFHRLEINGDELSPGMGLAITRQIVQQHKGSLEVESLPSRGATFTMSLPIWG